MGMFGQVVPGFEGVRSGAGQNTVFDPPPLQGGVGKQPKDGYVCVMLQ